MRVINREATLKTMIKILTRGRVPNPAESVVAAGDDEAAVAVEVDRAHRVRVCRQGLQALA